MTREFFRHFISKPQVILCVLPRILGKNDEKLAVKACAYGCNKWLKNKNCIFARTQNAVKNTTQFVQALASQGDEITLNHTLFFDVTC